jgi:hypothetical protein
MQETAAARKKARASQFAAPPSLPPLAEKSAVGARPITGDIQANRGLTPHRWGNGAPGKSAPLSDACSAY